MSDRADIAAPARRPDALRPLARLGGWPLAAAIALPLIAGALLLVQAGLLADILDRAIRQGARPEALVVAIAWLAAIFALRIALGAAAEAAGAVAAERIKRVLRAALHADLLARRPVWTATRSSGALSAAIVDQIEALDGFFARFLPAMIQAAILPIAFAVAVMPVDWVVGLLFLVTAPLIPVFMALVGWGAEAASRAQAESFARLSGLFADRLRGILTLKLLGRADRETELVAESSETLRRKTLGVLRIAFLSSAVLEFFAALGVAGAALYVGLTFLGHLDLRITPLGYAGGLFCLLMAPEIYQPLRLLAAHYHDRAGARAAVEQIEALFGAIPAPAAAPPAAEMAPTPSAACAVRLGGLRIETPDGRRAVIDGLSLDVPAGQHVAILGASGIGKTTLIEAVAGLRDASGAILVDGAPLGAIEPRLLRRRIAFVGQRPRLFHGTIAENIGLGRPAARAADIEAAARKAEVLAFAGDLPGGLARPVGEGGAGLSGGEAQRVALARLFLRDPGLILLDEPTAHLDAATESRLLDALDAFAAGRTMIVATHSPAVAARMDRVYRLAGGRLLPAPHHRRKPSAGGAEGVA